MKSIVVALMLTVAAGVVVPQDAWAKRLGGGGSSGMQRSTPPPRSAPDSLPAKPATAPAATPAAATGAAAAAAPKRSWLGPIAGLAAGLGLAALFSHLGLGEGLANFVMLALLVVAAVFVVRFLLRRFGPQAQRGAALRPAAAGAPAGMFEPMRFEPRDGAGASPAPIGSGAAAGAGLAAVGTAGAGATVASIPDGFDAPAFERIAKMIFIRMQAANDAGDLNDLRAFTTPEMFATARLDLQERAAAAQRTDVVRVDAEVLDVVNEAERQIVSVRFHGLVREEDGGVAEPFDEVWHLTKPADGSREWAIAGIQQSTPLQRAA